MMIWNDTDGTSPAPCLYSDGLKGWNAFEQTEVNPKKSVCLWWLVWVWLQDQVWWQESVSLHISGSHWRIAAMFHVPRDLTRPFVVLLPVQLPRWCCSDIRNRQMLPFLVCLSCFLWEKSWTVHMWCTKWVHELRSKNVVKYHLAWQTERWHSSRPQFCAGSCHNAAVAASDPWRLLKSAGCACT